MAHVLEDGAAFGFAEEWGLGDGPSPGGRCGL
jgi:hypothetical protein